MTNGQNIPVAALRDGTSQAGRITPELDPGYARVDERTTADLLAFARAYASELKYFGLDDPDEAQGTWSEFIGSLDIDAAAEFADAPATFAADRAAPYMRPHFALFLAFLKLLENARAQLNTLTRRHLEFFYRDILRMVRKPAVPDMVHVLVDLDNRTPELSLPAGTALRAGKDSLGKELVYRTMHTLVANQVEVEKISSLHAEIRITGIREASRQYLETGTRNEAFLGMMRIALGQPNPGDPLPVPIYPGVPKSLPNAPQPEVSFDDLVQAQSLIGLVESSLCMPLFDDFRELMRLKHLRQDNDAGDWREINAVLAKAGKARDAGFSYAPHDATAFQENLRTVLAKTPEEFAHLYDGLPEVKSIEDAYAVYLKRPDVQEFIRTKLYLSLDDFNTMMRTKGLMDNQWEAINQLLEKAGRVKRGDTAFNLPDAVRASQAFDTKLAAAVTFQYEGGIEAYHQAFRAVEGYFHMPAENFKFVMAVGVRASRASTDDLDWYKVYDIMAAAHREMIYARRRDLLRRAAQADISANNNTKALSDILVLVLADDVAFEEALRRLDGLGVTADDQAYLSRIAAGSEPHPDWDRVIKALEIAQRNREDFKDPVAEKVEWRNLYPWADAKSVLSLPEGKPGSRWKTFGRGEEARAREPVPSPVFGWALASPLLWLEEGKRSIRLTLGFSADPPGFDLQKIKTLLAPTVNTPTVAGFNPFQVQVSTAKGWLEPDSVTLEWSGDNMDYPKQEGLDTSKLRALVLSVKLSDGQPALTPLTRRVHGIDADLPVLRLMLRPVWDERAACYLTSYQALRALVLVRASLSVAVAGLAHLSLRNDQSTLDAKKPFEPFSTSPAVGARLALGHREIVAKRLDTLGFHITWMGVPSKLGDYYQNYPVKLDNSSFNAKVSLVDRNVIKDFPAALSLFDKDDATKPVAATLTAPSDQGRLDDLSIAAADVAEWNRYFIWELVTPDFQHAVYPSVAVQKSLQMAAAVAKGEKPDAAPYQVNPPYTPKIKSLTVDYASSAELVFDPAAVGASALRAFHVEPFGYAELQAEDAQAGCSFLPEYDFEGELYIGLRGVTAPQNVALLFQAAEGSANPDAAHAQVSWSYLSGNRWLTLQDGSLLADGTRGLINSGIVELSLKAALPNTRLPGDLYWIRAAVARATDGVCDMENIHPNAVVAAFDDQGNAPDHLHEPLAAGRITGPAAPLPGVASIRQPYTSFGGRMAEEDSSFYVRVSERLRHKQRALTTWDYERLVLERFPHIYKAKCLRADPSADLRQSGAIELIVIPDIRNRLPFDPFEPKAPVNVLRDIEDFLSDKTPPFVSVKVKNAHYVPVKVHCGVRFMPGEDIGYCKRRLNDELNRFLSPWAYEEGADIVIGGSIYANSIINFIDRREYVDYIAEFSLFTSEDEGRTFDPVLQQDGYHAGTRTPDGILVAAHEHEFDVITEADYRVEGYTGINYMRIELDFIVA